MTTKTTVIRTQSEGERRWFFGGGTHVWKVHASETDGTFVMFEDELVKGKVTPWHAHPKTDEALYVLEGEILVRVGDEERALGPGGVVMVPRETPHAFIVTSERARVLCIGAPGHEEFYREASEPAGETDGRVDFKKIREAGAKTGLVDILGPPPFTR
jgi:quercetin dioxygenase-like cupin family protein